ncbi:dTDP-4-dehydrorhamnose 3,5-epimerase [Aliifodinibius salicampi]|uniref:dTDP-4-dehydrorhamnose 3,5-epimerase n=1 Tax=Fodinibius salicampi TaxID=1920655 RepID=A0ABT3PV61_9BACT|nr:dTDP-4-dehydrorhamnose 3,5-epimerase [Fodinibius salicampi]MCW9711735.1 dTDP-4-dehydrorhamnose 3,5-epimerase [Fodinibius salicampi]
MIFHKTNLKDAYIIELNKLKDERGFFARQYCQNEFRDHGIQISIVQANVSYNKLKGTLRGMHYQTEPHGEAKLVRCTKGGIYDAIIDVRSGSPTFKKWIGVELTEHNHKMLYVPEGFAHGFITLQDDTEVTYQVSEFYTPGAEEGIRWNDPTFNIDWPAEVNVISEKDLNWPDFDSE